MTLGIMTLGIMTLGIMTLYEETRQRDTSGCNFFQNGTQNVSTSVVNKNDTPFY